MEPLHVVIVGGGFGGISAAKKLARKKLFKITLIDKKNYHLFQPLLYQIATAGLSPADIAYPLRAMFRHHSVKVLLGEVRNINKEEKWIETENNKINFDFLLLSCGSTYTYFNSPQWKKFAPGLKTISQAIEIRKKVFLAFEKAERATDSGTRDKYMTFVVVGGGPTGIELAGTLGEIAKFFFQREFYNIKLYEAKIILIEAGPHVLPTMSPTLQEIAIRELNELGVEVRLNAKVSDINEDGIRIADQFIRSGTVLWAAGVGANPLNQKLGVALDQQKRVIVKKDLSIPGYPDIFVIGDQAHFEWGPEGKALPGLAPVAIQQGRFVAKVLNAKASFKKIPNTFKYKDKGQMATIGRSKAVAMYKGVEFSGLIAWIAWLFIHVYYLIGFKNKISVLFQWAWTYITFRRGVRLIVDEE